MSLVPNEFPSVRAEYRLAIIGEAPGQHEEDQRRPFVGPAGSLLNSALQQVGLMRSACFVGNVCQHRPPGNDITQFEKNGHEFTSGLEQIRKDLDSFGPNLCLLLGNTPLWAGGSFLKIGEMRGTLFMGNENGGNTGTNPLRGRKCLGTYHPATILRQWDWAPLFQFDINRAKEESLSPELVLPQRKIASVMSAPECIRRLQAIPKHSKIALDIEGGVPNPTATTHKNLDGITCISIATNPYDVFILPFIDFDDHQFSAVLAEFARVMGDETIEKVLQNSLYDFIVICWLWKVPVRNVRHDTMLSGWEIYPELPKALGVQASIWTREPYYKNERKSEDKLTHFSYCCKDSAVTYEIHDAHMAAMSPSAREHYELNMKLLPSLQFMSLRGIKYDKKSSDSRKSELLVQMGELQAACEIHAGHTINLNSPKQMNQLLYKEFGLPPQYKIEAGRKTTSLRSDSDALLDLVVKISDQRARAFLLCALKWKKLEGQRRQLEIDLDHDGRVRCSYNLVGAETGRLSCSTSVTGSGMNLQTVMKINRQFYRADDGYHFFQCDLEGADGWTVAQHCADHGDPNMLEDLRAGLKPAKILAMMHIHGPQVSQLPRAELKALVKATPLPPDIYAMCKAVVHGSNYAMQQNRMSEVILKKSYKDSDDDQIIFVRPAECKKTQQLYFLRYKGIPAWHRAVEKRLQLSSTLPCASGHVRTFFGRPGDHQTHKEAYAHEPQANTTYVINLAMLNLWSDPENRRADGSLIIEPLHSVHDALCGQFPVGLTEWAVDKIRGWFQNPIRIGSAEIVIPYEGGYGETWWHTDEKHREGEI